MTYHLVGYGERHYIIRYYRHDIYFMNYLGLFTKICDYKTTSFKNYRRAIQVFKQNYKDKVVTITSHQYIYLDSFAIETEIL